MRATLIRKLDEPWAGDARLYRLDPPIEYDNWGDAPVKQTDHVIVSATIVPFTNEPETYIFPATSNGEPIEMLELPGSIKGVLDHTVALRRAGYTIGESQ